MLEKLDFLMQRDGLNKSALAKKSGIPYTTIDGLYKKGYENIRLPTLRLLSDFFGVTMEYLASEAAPDPTKKPTTVSDDELLDNELIQRLCALTPDEIQRVDAFVQGLLASR